MRNRAGTIARATVSPTIPAVTRIASAMLLVLLACQGVMHGQGVTWSDDTLFSMGINPEGVWYPSGSLGNRPWSYYETPEGVKEYEVTVTKAFSQKPEVARRVCAWSELTTPSITAKIRLQLRASLTRLCSAHPSGAEDRWKAEEWVYWVAPLPAGSTPDAVLKAQRAKQWLARRFDFELAEAAKMSPDIRRRAGLKVVEEIRSGSGDFRRFGKVLRAIALRPHDEEVAFFSLNIAKEATFRDPPGITESQAREFIDAIYKTRLVSNDGRRGLRAYLMYQGKLEEARAVGDKLMAGKNRPTTRDQLMQGLLEFVGGEARRLQPLLKQCPEADLDYVETSGAPKSAEHFCQDVLAGVASRLRQRLEQQRTEIPATLRELFLVTNRTAPGMHAPPPSTPLTVMKVPAVTTQQRAQADRELSSILNAAIARAKPMSAEERDHEYERLSSGGIGLDTLFEMIAVSPWADRPYSQILAHLPVQGGYLDAETASEMQSKRDALHGFLEQKAKTEIDWQMGLRSFLTYLGDYQRALDIDRKILANASAARKVKAEREPAYTNAHHGVLERILNNNPAPLKAYLARCSAPSKEFVEAWGEPKDRAFPCWQTVTQLNALIADSRKDATPVAVRAMLKEAIRAQNDFWPGRMLAIRSMRNFDLKETGRELDRLLSSTNPSPPDHYRQEALETAEGIALSQNDYLKGLAYLDEQLRDLGAQRPKVNSDVWTTLSKSRLPQLESDDAVNVMSRRVAVAMKLGDWKESTRTLEWLAADVPRTQAASLVRHRLVELALAEAQRGQLDRALRILGYVQGQPLEQHTEFLISEVRRVIAGPGKIPAKIAPQESPWATVPDAPAAKPRKST